MAVSTEKVLAFFLLLTGLLVSINAGYIEAYLVFVAFLAVVSVTYVIWEKKK